MQQAEGQRHLTLAIAGEFNAGKTAVLNLMVHRKVLDSTATAGNLPPLRLRAASTDGLFAPDGTISPARLPLSAQDAASAPAGMAARLDGWQGVDLVEVSAGQDGTFSPAAQAALAGADLLIWCTMAQRAWALSEITLVEALPTHLRRDAVLVVARSAMLPSDSARAKVTKRLRREASGHFAHILMVDASARALADMGQDQAWQRSGGAALAGLIGGLVAGHRPGRTDSGPEHAPAPAPVHLQQLPRLVADWLEMQPDDVPDADLCENLRLFVAYLLHDLDQTGPEPALLQPARQAVGKNGQNDDFAESALDFIDIVLQLWGASDYRDSIGNGSDNHGSDPTQEIRSKRSGTQGDM